MKLPRFPICLLAVLPLGLTFASDLPRATPESQGIPSSAILNLIEKSEKDAENVLHSMIIIRHGHIVAEGYWSPFEASQPHELFSLSKSFTSTAVGLAVEESLLDIDTPVLELFPDDRPAESNENLDAMTLRHLLTMSTGQAKEPSVYTPQPGVSTAKRFLEHPIEFEPGERFAYNTPATFMLSAAMHKVTGERLLDFLEPRLFGPLGIENATWQQSQDGIDWGGFGLGIKTMDIAKFGQLLLQRGQWKGEQLVPESWIAEATRKQISNGTNPENDWESGYGFQFWMNSEGGYRADGAFGQLCVVLPEHDLVFVANAAVKDIGVELGWIWNDLLPHLQDSTIEENAVEQEKLNTKLSSLRLPCVQGVDRSLIVEGLTGKTFTVAENTLGLQSVRFDFEKEQPEVHWTSAAGEEIFAFGFNEWATGMLTRRPYEGPLKTYSSGAWQDDNTLRLSVLFQGKVQAMIMDIEFDGDSIQIDPVLNVSFGPTELERITGRSASD